MDPTNNVTSGTLKIRELRNSMKLLKDKLLHVGPRITQTDLLLLLENTGKKFRDGKWSFGKKRSSKKGRKSVPEEKLNGTNTRRAKILEGDTPRAIQQPWPPRWQASRSIVLRTAVSTGGP